MVQFASALGLFLATANSALALRIPDSLHDVVNKETMRVPSLRNKDADRKNVLHNKLAGMAVRPSEQTKRKLQDEDYYGADYVWDESMDANGAGFDITNYSVKYTQCATVQTYSDNLAAEEYIETVLAAERFALFRLCPSDQCSSYSNSGCGSNYGEYIVSLDQFMLAMLEYQEHRVAGYCEYCQNCASIESGKAFYKDVASTKEFALQSAEESYQTWYTTYLEDMYASSANGNGDNAYNAETDMNTLAQQYYQSVRDASNYANQYAANNYGSSSSNGYSSASANSGNYNWANQNMWQTQSSSLSSYTGSDSWSNMGSRGGSFYGRPILNGYYENGAFVQQYGYFNGEGTYVSLEDEDITWDETLWGEQPDGWGDIDQDTESCSFKYAGSCYNQYDACMQILDEQDYETYNNYQNANYQNAQNGQYNNNQYQAAAQQNYQAKMTLKDFLGCVEVDPTTKYGATAYQQSQYAQQQNYQQAAATTTTYNCYDGDENCAKMQAYAEQMAEYEAAKSANRQYFIGPHCASNGRDVSLAVYSDQYCTVVDSESTVEDMLGYSPYSSSINLFPSECLPCMVDEEQEAWYEDEEVYYIEPVCAMLYQYSGKCNKHLTATEYNYEGYVANGNYQYQNQEQAQGDGYGNYADNEWKQMYQSENQAQNENAVCAYIEALTSGTYNENGEINVSGSSWAASSLKELYNGSRSVNGGMKAALIITSLAAAAMAVAACMLHAVLARKNIPWKPRRSKGQDPTDLARQNSGITMGRSRSGPGNNPLL